MARTATRTYTATCHACGQTFTDLTAEERYSLLEGGCDEINAECNGGEIAVGDIWTDPRYDIDY